jgi:hypothetical protein
MPKLNNHTHCQAPRANAKDKACQRVCLFQRTERRKWGDLRDPDKFAFRCSQRSFVVSKAVNDFRGFRLVLLVLAGVMGCFMVAFTLNSSHELLLVASELATKKRTP